MQKQFHQRRLGACVYEQSPAYVSRGRTGREVIASPEARAALTSGAPLTFASSDEAARRSITTSRFGETRSIRQYAGSTHGRQCHGLED